MSKGKGLFIAIEGGDGSGKATQVKELVKRLEAEGHKDLKVLAFPRYGHPAASDVEAYLRGDLGAKEDITPQDASRFYANDRKDASAEINEALAQGKIVLADRFVSSNKAHQGAQIPDPKERAEFYNWLDDLEHGGLDIPRPDRVIVLAAPAAQRDANVGKRQGAKRDILEGDLPYQERVDKAYRELGESEEDHVYVNCLDDDGKLLPIHACHEKVWEHVKPLLK